MADNNIVYKERRRQLIEKVKKHYNVESGSILLFAGLEHEHVRFRQESSFYYLTGIDEPAVMLWLDLNEHATLFIPNHGTVRAKWVLATLDVTEEKAYDSGVDAITYLGVQCDGYQMYPFFKAAEHEHLLKKITDAMQKKEPLFSLCPSTPYGYVEQRWILERLNSFVPGFIAAVKDVSAQVAQLRRVKSMDELENIFRAIEITAMAQEAAAAVIKPGNIEYEVQAALEYIFTEAGAQRPAFPSIVGSGKNSTVLHYTQNNRPMLHNDLVVVDIGAEYNYYCADITRTYPVSGAFKKRQLELYDIVLETQTYIADLVQPGYWISNKDEPDKSLNHLTKKFLKEKGYDQYMPHGIGHFLGMDVHDVGNPLEPLQEGDIITIEPGIYIPEEEIGIRIEDNYWIVKDGAVCLSEDLVKEADEVAEMVGQDLADVATTKKSKNSNFDA